MAIMWPRSIPRDVLRNPLRSTECEVFRRLEAQLDNSFTVFYSRPWLGLTSTGEEIDGECDFLVCHAALGMLAIEVKGGAISFDPATDHWTSRDRSGFRHTIRNPVQQARSSKHRILEKLKTSHHWQPRYIRARHGVILPHSARPPGDLGADMPRRLFCFLEQFNSDLREWVLDRFGDTSDDTSAPGKLGVDGIRALEKILALPFQLRTPLGHILSGDDQEISVLTQQQFHILQAIEAIPRAAISGAAGTGKTVLAIEEARRCAAAGLRTLYTCFNRALAFHVNRIAADTPSVLVSHFHSLCASLVQQAGLAMPQGIPSQRLYEEVLPEMLAKAVELRPSLRFDAIIVDEGQDFHPLWWLALDAALKPGDASRLRVFYDSNQRLYSSTTTLPQDVQLVPIRLTWNLRNTQRIHETVIRHYDGHPVTALGPEGVAIENVEIGSPDLLRSEVDRTVRRLVNAEQVRLEDIAVLVEDELLVAALAPNGLIGTAEASRCDDPMPGACILDTIRRFKGLESRVIVLVASDSLGIENELRYVAFSRARTHLVVIGSRRGLNPPNAPR